MARINVAGLDGNDGDVESVRDELYGARPAGEYAAKIIEVILTATKDKPGAKHPGSPMLQFKIALVATEDFIEKKLYHWIILANEDYMDADKQRLQTTELKRLVLATGLNSEDDSFDTDDLYGRDLLVVVGIETQTTGPYAGKEQNRLTDFLPL